MDGESSEAIGESAIICASSATRLAVVNWRTAGHQSTLWLLSLSFGYEGALSNHSFSDMSSMKRLRPRLSKGLLQISVRPYSPAEVDA